MRLPQYFVFCFFAFLIRIQDNFKTIHQPVPLSYCQTQEPIVASDCIIIFLIIFFGGGYGGGGYGGGWYGGGGGGVVRKLCQAPVSYSFQETSKCEILTLPPPPPQPIFSTDWPNLGSKMALTIPH